MAKRKVADADRQLNLGFGRHSKLRRDLMRARSVTGMERSKIVREVLEQFLPVWLERRARDKADVKRMIGRIRSEVDQR